MVSLMLMVLSAVVWAPAAASPAGAQGGTFACTVVASPTGFDVTWSPGRYGDEADSDADRFVIDRQVFGQFHWRGRVETAASTFSDSRTPTNVGRVRYRVAVWSGTTLLERVECDFTDSVGFDCAQEELGDGRYNIAWQSSVPAEGAVDFVVRRSVSPEGPSYWRTRTTSVDFVDGSSPTGSADYQVLMRFGRRIAGIANCGDTNGPPPPPPDCALVQPIGPEQAEAFRLPLTRNGSLYFNTEDNQFVRVAPNATETTVLGTPPGRSPVPLAVESDGSVLFSTSTEEFGRELWRFDLAARTSSLVADINPGRSDSFVSVTSMSRGAALVTAEDGSGLARLYEYDEASQSLTEVEEVSELQLNRLRVLGEGPGDLVYLYGTDEVFQRPVIEWNRSNGSVRTLDYASATAAVSGPDGKVYIGDDEGLWQLDPATGQNIKVVDAFELLSIGQLEAGPGDLVLYSIVDERDFGRLQAFDTSTGRIVQIDNPSLAAPSRPAIGNDARVYTVSNRDGQAAVLWSWDPATGRSTVIGDDVLGIRASELSDVTAVGSGTLVLRDSRTGQFVSVDPSCLAR